MVKNHWPRPTSRRFSVEDHSGSLVKSMKFESHSQLGMRCSLVELKWKDEEQKTRLKLQKSVNGKFLSLFILLLSLVLLIYVSTMCCNFACLSVCPFVCLSHSYSVLKRLNVSSSLIVDIQKLIVNRSCNDLHLHRHLLDNTFLTSTIFSPDCMRNSASILGHLKRVYFPLTPVEMLMTLMMNICVLQICKKRF